MKGNILVVDDSPQTLRLLVDFLSAEQYTVRPADSGELALSSIAAERPELILLDVKMPGLNGFDVCRRLKQEPSAQAIPVIFLSGLNDLDDKVQGFRLGAVDFVAKPFQRDELLARVQTHLELGRLRNRLAEEVAAQTRELQIAYQELSRASQLKDEFLSTMSHELRTPLTAILGLAEILRDGAYGELKPEQAEALALIEGSGRNLLQLINDILDYAQLEAGKVTGHPVLFGVADIVESELATISEKAALKNIQISAKIEAKDSLGWGDPQHVKKILAILLDNAVKFTPAGGKAGLVVRFAAGSNDLEFEIWDNGPGIAEADLPKLFKPFVQLNGSLSRTHEGSGLGLALARKLARLQGGEIRVESQVSEGSRIVFLLPQEGAEHE